MGIVRIKRSTTPGSIPQGLVAGELAYNLADRKLYALDSTSGLRSINFTSDAEKVTSGPIADALDSKLSNTSVTGSDGKTYIAVSVSDSTKYIALLDTLP